MEFPNQVKVETLAATHPEYDAQKLMLYSALYEGSSAVRREPVMRQLMIKRELEKVAECASQYTRRCERAAYINRAGGLIDWFCASVFPHDPVVSGPSDYWQTLNDDTDGLGTTFGTLCRMVLREMLVNQRSYLQAKFDRVEPGQAVRMDSEDGELDARLLCVCAPAVDDWHCMPDGSLEWVRLHGIEPMRSGMEQASEERHTWTYYAGNDIRTYEAAKKISETWAPDEVARLVYEEAHDFGLPVFDLRGHHGQWVMDRVYDVVKALFNREASVTWALDMQAYAVPVLTLNSNRQVKMFGSELFALRLEQGEVLSFVAPPSTIFEPLFKDAERLSKDLYETVQGLAINAAAIPQAGRLSGDAVGQMREPLQVLLHSFALPVKDAVQRACNAIRDYRGEDGDIELEGFDAPADVDAEDLQNAIGSSVDTDEKPKETQNGRPPAE